MGFRPSKVANAAMSTHLRLETGLDYIVQAILTIVPLMIYYFR